jgi:hypothetical protein
MMDLNLQTYTLLYSEIGLISELSLLPKMNLLVGAGAARLKLTLVVLDYEKENSFTLETSEYTEEKIEGYVKSSEVMVQGEVQARVLLFGRYRMFEFGLKMGDFGPNLEILRTLRVSAYGAKSYMYWGSKLIGRINWNCFYDIERGELIERNLKKEIEEIEKIESFDEKTVEFLWWALMFDSVYLDVKRELKRVLESVKNNGTNWRMIKIGYYHKVH